jgi:hypothetical protein
MKLPHRLILGIAALALAGAAAWTMLDRPSAAEIAEAVVLGPDGDPIDPASDAAREREERRANSRNLGSMQRRDQDAAAGRAPEAGNAGDPGGLVDAASAARGFEIIMTKVERTADRRTKLDREEWDDLYRNANDAFAALSVHVDATDPAQMAELEQAHARLLEGLRRVRVRGNKKLVD